MTRTSIHPAEHLAEQLKETGMSAAELARRLKIPTLSPDDDAGQI